MQSGCTVRAFLSVGPLRPAQLQACRRVTRRHLENEQARHVWTELYGGSRHQQSSHVARAGDEPSTNPVKETEEEPPPWVRREQEQKLREKEGGGELPFGIYLIASALVAIAAVGSIFEWTAKNAIFGVLPPDNFLYTPILGLFALTGFPTAGWLFVKAITSANEESARQDKLDGF